jgi:hypothetical protein
MDSARYIAYLLSEPKRASCVRAGDILEVSHDEINRFLLSGDFTGKDLFNAVKDCLELVGGTCSLDDTVLDKFFSDMDVSELVGRFWSGRHHRVVVGINLLTLHYTPPEGGDGFPVNFRVVNKTGGKTKHEHLREMATECLLWGLAPEWFTADSYYACLKNLKFLKHREIGFMIGLESNRLISTVAHQYEHIGEAEIPENGLFTHLKGFDFIKVFRTVADDGQARHYAVYRNDPEERQTADRGTLRHLRQVHWNIEKSYRVLKQVCHLGHFFVRDTKAVTSHLFCALRAFQRLVFFADDKIIENLYEIQHRLFKAVQRQFVREYA